MNIRANTARLFKEEFMIDPKVTEMLFEKGIIQEHNIKKILIRDEYNKKVEPKGKQILKTRIAEKYCVSVKLVEKVIIK